MMAITKPEVLLGYARQYGLGILVETGTFGGDTSLACAPHFDAIFTIELSFLHFMAARKKFAGEQFSHVVPLLGDSAQVLPIILKHFWNPALFWLDGHFSGGSTAKGAKETPILEELYVILSTPYDHVIIIDDARCFQGGGAPLPDYPHLNKVRELTRIQRPDYTFEVMDDIIRLLPPLLDQVPPTIGT